MSKKKRELVLKIAEQLQDKYLELKEHLSAKEEEWFNDLYSCFTHEINKHSSEDQISSFRNPNIHFPVGDKYCCCISFQNSDKHYIVFYKLTHDAKFEVIQPAVPRRFKDVIEHIS